MNFAGFGMLFLQSRCKSTPKPCNMHNWRKSSWMFLEKTSAGEAEASFRKECPRAFADSMQLNNNLSYN